MKKMLAMLMVLVSIAPFVSAANGFALGRVIHASPDAPPVDILVNDKVGLSDIDFKQITRYNIIRPGEYNLKVVPTGETEPVVIEADLDFNRWRKYTIVALDNLAEIEPLVLIDKPKFIPRRFAEVRFVHASPDAPAVDVAVKEGPVLFSDVSFKEVADYVQVDAGIYDLEVRLAGTNTTVLSLDDVGIFRGGQQTVFAVGEVGEGTLGAIISDDKIVRPRRLT